MFDSQISGGVVRRPATSTADRRVLRPTASAMSTIVLLSGAQPMLDRLAREREGDGLTADRVVRIRQRVRSGFYSSAEMSEHVARRIAASLSL